MRPAGVFERLLPYAIIFGLSQRWGKAFAGLYRQPPDWYQPARPMDFSTWMLVNGLDRSIWMMNRTFPTQPRVQIDAGSGRGGGYGWSAAGSAAADPAAAGSAAAGEAHGEEHHVALYLDCRYRSQGAEDRHEFFIPTVARPHDPPTGTRDGPRRLDLFACRGGGRTGRTTTTVRTSSQRPATPLARTGDLVSLARRNARNSGTFCGSCLDLVIRPRPFEWAGVQPVYRPGVLNMLDELTRLLHDRRFR